ncbi:hypothetical protein [Prochlorococcus sp. MIT 0916]|uniref:hypothetical protein n=1 Tax=Prochlorococcus sp. MIT 0916 TaxID=3082521 RepID=UPI0039B3B9DA
MNDSLSWDPSLVKKYSSSNHFKLLNQLRSEVKKYPLNNKRKLATIKNNGSSLNNKGKLNVSQNENINFSNNSVQINDFNTNKTNVSFNNAKDFSIYNNTGNNHSGIQNNSTITNNKGSNTDESSQTFKDRLDQIDMK